MESNSVNSIQWIKSTQSVENNCIEVAFTKSFVHVRDSKSPSRVLDFTYDEWDAFVAGAKDGEFDI